MSAKVAIVAGAGGALGHATALTLATGGLTVVAVDRSERGLGDFPGSVRPEVADATDPAAAKSLVDRCARPPRPRVPAQASTNGVTKKCSSPVVLPGRLGERGAGRGEAVEPRLDPQVHAPLGLP